MEKTSFEELFHFQSHQTLNQILNHCSTKRDTPDIFQNEEQFWISKMAQLNTEIAEPASDQPRSEIVLVNYCFFLLLLKNKMKITKKYIKDCIFQFKQNRMQHESNLPMKKYLHTQALNTLFQGKNRLMGTPANNPSASIISSKKWNQYDTYLMN